MHLSRFARPAALAAACGAAALLAACADAPTALTHRSAVRPSFEFGTPVGCGVVPSAGVEGCKQDGDTAVHNEHLQVCKFYAAGDAGVPVQVRVDVTNPERAPESRTFTINPGECSIVWERVSFDAEGNLIPTPDHVTVTELVPTGYKTQSQLVTWTLPGALEDGLPVEIDTAAATSSPSVGADIGGAHLQGALVVYTNTKDVPPPPPPPPAAGKIGDYAWIDANGNGRQDAGEPSLAGVRLTLGGTSTGTLTTGSNGAYLFTGLLAGNYTVTATAPAGFIATTAQASGTTGANDSNLNPSSVTLPTNSSQDLTIDFGFVALPGGGQGCTPGYWKQSQHFDSWRWYQLSDKVDATFNITFRSTLKGNPTGSITLLQGLGLNGNSGAEALIRHGVAALLNSVYHSNVSYKYTAPQVIKMVHDAYTSGNYNTMNAVKDQLEAQNQAGCPLN